MLTYCLQETSKPLILLRSPIDYESKGRGFESRRAHFPEAKKIKASGIFYAFRISQRIVVECQRLKSTVYITVYIASEQEAKERAFDIWSNALIS